MHRVILYFLLYLYSLPPVFATEVKGILTDQNSVPLPYANVYINGTTTGTTTNNEGRFSIALQPGSYELVFQFIGYKKHIEKIEVGEQPVELNIKMYPESITLSEVVVKSPKEDPAYPIIRKAIEKRKYYLLQVEGFSADVYIKGLQRILKSPKKILGQDVDFGTPLDSSGKGIVYLSESESKLYYKRPDKYREFMYSSKVSGDNKAFSWNQASDMGFNFYDNKIHIDELSERAFISPIAENALFYYRYRLIGTFTDNGILVNKIEVVPKRRYDPVFRGYIYINDSLWNIHSAELTLTKDANIDFVDTLLVTQTHVPVNDTVWMPISQNFYFFFKVLGIEGNGHYIGVLANYEINPKFERNFFGDEIIEVKEDANTKDSAYWEQSRPVPLTEEERNDYRIKDSLEALHHSKSYMDSIDRKNNKLGIMKFLLTGYTYTQRYKKREYQFSPLIQNVQFNTVEGLVLGLNTTFFQRYEEDWGSAKWYALSPYIRYGVSNEHLNGGIQFTYRYNPLKRAVFSSGIGHDVFQFGRRRELKDLQIQNPVSPLLNTVYTLLDEHNYMKIYEKAFAWAAWTQELVNGVYFLANVEYAGRKPLLNTTDYTWVDYESRRFTSNDPQNPLNENFSFRNHEALTLTMNFRLRYGQKYYTRPKQKIIIGSKYPDFNIYYRGGLPALGSDVNYHLLEAGLDDDMKLGLFGTSAYHVNAGIFLDTSRMTFIDYRHFIGNRTLFSNGYLTAFQLLDYYAFSTQTYFVEAHYEHHFNGFLFNKIPLWRKLRFQEVGGFHFLYTEDLKEYMEVSFGIENVFKFARIDFVTSYNRYQRIRTGVRIGLEGF